jgi:UDP-3-O-[3-hydroxymyristoyl] N-acetylglucosamine deacetylase
VLFRAADGTFISASAETVVDTRSATTVGAFGVKVRSIEHLMAALGGLGIDNVLVDTDAEELPAADGSAKPFVDLLEEGRSSLPAPRRRLMIAGLRVGDEPLARDRALR